MDEDGYLWFVERARSLIKCGGHRVSPSEVEDIAYESGLVTHAVAYGVDDDALGQVIHLLVAAEGRDIDIPALERYCRQNLPTYMAPRSIRKWEGPIPMSGTGKIDRRALVEAYGKVEWEPVA
jgi:acyl-CoA synthetase (AMP-forming)/AMP-acid ligase II